MTDLRLRSILYFAAEPEGEKIGPVQGRLVCTPFPVARRSSKLDHLNTRTSPDEPNFDHSWFCITHRVTVEPLQGPQLAFLPVSTANYAS